VFEKDFDKKGLIITTTRKGQAMVSSTHIPPRASSSSALPRPVPWVVRPRLSCITLASGGC